MKRNGLFDKFIKTGNIIDYLDYKTNSKKKTEERYGTSGGNNPKNN